MTIQTPAAAPTPDILSLLTPPGFELYRYSERWTFSRPFGMWAAERRSATSHRYWFIQEETADELLAKLAAADQSTWWEER